MVYEPDPAQRRSDWLFEREWRLCFEEGETPELATPPELVAGVIVGAPG
ncbi:hypothetical protein [Streptomyces yanii]|uniref:Uncharacterized protein n=1 Tax=Streptomyces yanii TaxID=78510 RepID=A0ABV5R6L4_9ACTN